MLQRARIAWRSVAGLIQSEQGRQAAGSLVALLVLTGTSQLCGLGMLLLAARSLSQAGLGVFLFAQSVQMYLAHLSGVGAAQVLVREAAAAPGRTDELTTTYLTVAGSATFVVHAAAAVVVLIAWPGPEERALFGWLLLGSPFSSLSLLPLFDAQHRHARAGVVVAVVDVLALGAFAAAAWTGALGVATAGLLTGSKWGLTFLGHLAVYQLTVRRLRWSFDGALVWPFLSSGARVLVGVLLLLVPVYGGVILTRLLRSEAETALMGVATQVAAVYFLLCWQATRVVAPHIAGPHGTERWFVRQLAFGLGGVGVALAVAAGSAAALLVVLVLGESYRPALGPMVLLLLAVLLVAVGMVVGVYLHRFRRENVVVTAHLGGVICYLLTAPLLIQVLGPGGASLGALLSAVCSTAALGAFVRAHVRGGGSG